MNEEFNKKNFDELLKEFDKLTFRERQNPTFLEILKQQTRETAWSNVLAFYFNPNKEHKLYDLLLKSFFEALGKTDEVGSLNAIKVNPEVSTENRKRIDLVIEADSFVIGIENKVNHWLNNDLEEYGKKIIQIANKKSSYKVVLSKFHCCPDHDFINLTYEVFIKHITRNLPYYTENANQEYLMFLNDFLRNIENEIKTKDMIENKEAFEYFKANYSEIEKLSSKFIQFKEEVERKFWEIRDAIDLKRMEESIKQRFKVIVDIKKADIEYVNGVSTFWINVSLEYTEIQFEIYINDGYGIYCYLISEDETNKSKIDPGDYGFPIALNEDTQVIAAKIYELIENVLNRRIAM